MLDILFTACRVQKAARRWNSPRPALRGNGGTLPPFHLNRSKALACLQGAKPATDCNENADGASAPRGETLDEPQNGSHR